MTTPRELRELCERQWDLVEEYGKLLYHFREKISIHSAQGFGQVVNCLHGILLYQHAFGVEIRSTSYAQADIQGARNLDHFHLRIGSFVIDTSVGQLAKTSVKYQIEERQRILFVESVGKLQPKRVKTLYTAEPKTKQSIESILCKGKSTEERKIIHEMVTKAT